MRMPLIPAVIVAMSFSAPSFAGPQYVDPNGYAVSGYDVVAFFDLKQAPVGGDQPAAVPGKANITAEYNGATFAFSSRANRKKFLASPATYAPQYDGHCAYGVAQGSKVPANPNLWRIINDKLYLNITEAVEDYWEDDIGGNIKRSERNWSGRLARGRASRQSVPEFSGKAPVAGS